MDTLAGNPEYRARADASTVERMYELVAEAGGFPKFAAAVLAARRNRGADWLEVPPAGPAAVGRAREAGRRAGYKAGHADGLREARSEADNERTMLGYREQSAAQRHAEADQREHALAGREARRNQQFRRLAHAWAGLPGGRTALANALFMARREDHDILEFMAEEVGVSIIDPNETLGPDDARRKLAELVFTEAKAMVGDVLHRDPDLALRAAAEVLDTMAGRSPTVHSQAGEVRPAAVAAVLRALWPWANRQAATAAAQDRPAPRRYVMK